MARYFDGTGDYLYRNAAVKAAAPLTVACQYYNTNVAASVNIIGIGDNSAWSYFVLWYNTAGDTINWAASSANNPASATTTTNISANTWHHICGVEASSTSRAVYLDGGNKGTNATSRTPGGLDVTAIGGLILPNTYVMPGRLAEVAVWNVALSDSEVAQLALGLCPLLMRPGDLLAYWPLGGIYGRHINDLVGGYHLTSVGDVAWADHPTKIWYPNSGIVVPWAAAAAPTGNRRRRLLLAG